MSGFPSLHLTPGRIVNVSVLLSLLHAYDEASQFVVEPLFRPFTNVSSSYTGPNARNWVFPLNGLNPHVHVVPCSFEIVTELPLEPPPDLPPPHAVAKRPTATARTITRFIIDSFPIAK